MGDQIRHIGYYKNAPALITAHFERTGERIHHAYTQDYEADTYTFHMPCNLCGHIYKVTVPGAGLFQYNQGGLIPVVFPDLSDSDRELLISNTCATCWAMLWATDEEDEEDL